VNLDRFTVPQRDAITTEHKRVLAVAGPGSGKTTTLVARIEGLLDDAVDPRKMAAISFTNAASNELSKKLPLQFSNITIKGSYGDADGSLTATAKPISLGFLGTLHSFALRMLKEHGQPFGYGLRTAIISPDSAEDLMAAKAHSLGSKTAVAKLLKLKADKGRPERGRRLSLDETVVATYLDELKEAAVVDYDVLLHEFLEMITGTTPGALSAQQSFDGTFDYLFVDEVQDSAPIDWRIYRALAIPNKFLVGDPDQNLYEFRGARLREMVEEAANPDVHVVKLEENFRSKANICDAAQRLIEHNSNRVAKRTISVPGLGGIVHRLGDWENRLGDWENEGEEIAVVARQIKKIRDEEALRRETYGAEAVAERSIAVLSRTNVIADAFRKTLPHMGVPVAEHKRYELPKDWAFARSLIEVLIAPDNDSLAYFHALARSVRQGATQAGARKAATNLRLEANSQGKTINQRFFKLEPITRPESALAALVGAGVSREAHMIAVEKWRELPPGATMEEFALSLANVTEYVKEGDGEGVKVLTVHGAKGKEFDVVFLVGFEDEAYPGMDAKDGPEGVEGARRCAYVAMTRARSALYFTTAKSRATAWKAIVSRKPSRFFEEIGI